jgi:hypothetical protein
MADKIDFYRGYDIAYYYRGRNGKVRIQIREAEGLPPIVVMPQEDSMRAAEQKARNLINRALADAENSN